MNKHFTCIASKIRLFTVLFSFQKVSSQRAYRGRPFLMSSCTKLLLIKFYGFIFKLVIKPRMQKHLRSRQTCHFSMELLLHKEFTHFLIILTSKYALARVGINV